MKWHVAQYLSLIRILLAPLCLIYLSDIPYKTEITIILGAVAGATDYFDGVLARKQGLTSSFGAVLDYTADKVFVITALCILSIAGKLAPWIVVFFVFREIVTMGMRLAATEKDVTINASSIGKYKTTIIFFAMLFLLLDWHWHIYVFYFAILLATVSFAEYFQKFAQAIKTVK